MATRMRLPVPGARPAGGGQSTPRYNPYANPTPGAKIGAVGAKFGYKGIDKQQGTTRVIYDYIPFDGRTLFEFFAEVNTKQFPFTNLNENKLQVGEAISVQRMFLAIITTNAETGDVISSMEIQQSGLSGLYRADLNFQIDTQIVMKPINVQSFQPQFNYASNWGALAIAFNPSPPTPGVVTSLTGNAVKHADTLIVIPPLVQFQFNMKTDGYVPVANLYLGLTIEGVGAILSAKGTF